MRCAMNKTLACLTLPLLACLLAGCSTPVPQSLPPPMLPKTFTGPVRRWRAGLAGGRLVEGLPW